jgi:hypothetical protein
MLKHSIRLVIHYLKFWDVPVPYPSYHFNRALAEANRLAKTSFDPSYHTSIQQRQGGFLRIGYNINSGSKAAMISNPRLIVGRKV